MKITSVKPGYAHKVVEATLEGDEPSLPSEVLVMMADGVSRERALDIHAKKGHPGHFGYRSFSVSDGKLRVTIYTD